MSIDLNHGSECRYGEPPAVPEPVSTMKIPSGIGAALRRELNRIGLSDAEATRQLGISKQALQSVCHEKYALSPEVACRLHRIGIDGRALFLSQASNQLRWYENREARR